MEREREREREQGQHRGGRVLSGVTETERKREREINGRKNEE